MNLFEFEGDRPSVHPDASSELWVQTNPECYLELAARHAAGVVAAG